MAERRGSVASQVSAVSVSDKFSVISGANENDDAKDLTEGLSAKEKRSMLCSPLRTRLLNLISNPVYTITILVLVFIHIVSLILDSIDSIAESAFFLLQVVDLIVLGILLYDCSLKLITWRLIFFKSFVMIMDLLLVLCDILAFVLPHTLPSQTPEAEKAISLLQSFRCIRILWCVGHVKNLSIIVSTLMKSSRYAYAPSALTLHQIHDKRRHGKNASKISHSHSSWHCLCLCAV